MNEERRLAAIEEATRMAHKLPGLYEEAVRLRKPKEKIWEGEVDFGQELLKMVRITSWIMGMDTETKTISTDSGETFLEIWLIFTLP